MSTRGGKKTKNQPKTKTEKINAQLSSMPVPLLYAPCLTVGPFASATESCSEVWVFLPCPAFTSRNTAWVEMNSTNISLNISQHRLGNDLRDQLYDVALLYVGWLCFLYFTNFFLYFTNTKHLPRHSCNGQIPPAFGVTKPTNMISPLGMHLNGHGIFLFQS